MSRVQSDEPTVERLDEVTIDPDEYEVVRVESHGRWLVVVVRERETPVLRPE